MGVLPIELIMIVYKYCKCEEKAILNKLFKLNYKKFNPLNGVLKLINYDPRLEFVTKDTDNIIIRCQFIDIISGKLNCDLIYEISNLKRKIRKQSDQLEILMNILVNKNIIPEKTLDLLKS